MHVNASLRHAVRTKLEKRWNRRRRPKEAVSTGLSLTGLFEILILLTPEALFVRLAPQVLVNVVVIVVFVTTHLHRMIRHLVSVDQSLTSRIHSVSGWITLELKIGIAIGLTEIVKTPRACVIEFSWRLLQLSAIVRIGVVIFDDVVAAMEGPGNIRSRNKRVAGERPTCGE